MTTWWISRVLAHGTHAIAEECVCAQPVEHVQGIHLGVRIALQTRAQANPFQPYRSFVGRLCANCQKLLA
ncbi:hypothetical protein Y032_0002g943 [Ancylostoma ceylanicum]|uniref:Uncharacterized protein n=1 Tax=Ancylostoma ceylanicum TaxID=53326 RepID=A0A016W1I1_9BILA|nr:hypothetical protein Y032_0002g943 [Ancylostoma ceylanicum]